ncbi:Uncharacterized protein Rs2_15797 [Raphanus sativus]|nr:Uncharacterized protein Rs2_15797 [Raphanus sativus]
MILAPREGLSIISGIPNKDIQWRDKFFVFKVNPASVGDFDFSRIPRECNENIAKRFPCFSFRAYAYAMTPERNRAAPIALEEPVRPQQDRKGKKVKRAEASAGAEPLKRAQRTPKGHVLRPRSQAPSPLLLAMPVSVAILVLEDQSASHIPVELDVGGDRVDSGARRTRRLDLNEVVLADLSSSSSMPPLVTQAPGEGTS